MAPPAPAAADPAAVEAVEGFVRAMSEPFCLTNCGNYYLEDTTGNFVVFISGSFGGYLNLYIRMMGYRAACGQCVSFFRTTPVTVVPLTGVEAGGPTLPWSARLGQNFPNPFNPVTVIPFTLTRRARVRITIYDALGREVSLVADRDFAAGDGSVTWDASGRPTGVYYYELRAVPAEGPTVLVKKTMVLLR